MVRRRDASATGAATFRTRIAFSLDMSMLALTEGRVFEGALGPVQTLAFSPDNRILVGGDTVRNLTAWDLEGNVVWQTDLRSDQAKVRPIERIRSLAFSRDAKTLYVASGDKLRGIDAEDGRTIWHYEAPRAFAFLIISPNSVAVLGNGNLVCSLENGTIGIWSPDGKRLKMWHDNDGPRFLGVLPDGLRMAGSDRYTVCIWDLVTSAKIAKMRPAERVYAFAVNPVSPTIAVRTLGAIELWNVDDQERTAHIEIEPSNPVLVSAPTVPWFAFTEGPRTQIIDANGGSVGTLEERAVALAFSYNADLLAIGRRDSTAVIAAPTPNRDHVTDPGQ